MVTKVIKAHYVNMDGNLGDEYHIVRLPMPYTLTHPLTGEEMTIDNQYVMFKNDGENPLLITGIEVENQKICDKLHVEDWKPTHEIIHPNVSRYASHYPMTFNKLSKEVQVTLKCEAFCNPLIGKVLWENLEENIYVLPLQLEKFHMGSPLYPEFVNYVDFKCTDRIVKCQHCGNPILPSAGNTCIALNNCPQCFENKRDTNISDLISMLQQNPDRIFCKTKGGNRYAFSSPEDFKANANAHKLSKIYPQLRREDIEKTLGELPRQEMDLCVMGLGSAGSGLIDQIGRTKMFNKYTLIDYDLVEAKNLRNQLYHKQVVGQYKSDAMSKILKSFRPQEDNSLVVNTCNMKFQDVKTFKYNDYKYAMLAFDSIEARLEALDWIIKGDISTQYIIDTRYDGLAASVYLIDVHNEQEVAYYKDALETDGAMFAQQEAERKAKEDAMFRPVAVGDEPFERLVDKRYYVGAGDCAYFCSDCLKLDHKTFCDNIGQSERARETNCDCWETICKPQLADYINEHKIKIEGTTFDKPESTATTCVDWNIIDIYKYASTYITAALREIEDGKDKPFTHVECLTEKLPSSLVLM
jgi:molybdopterin/thiamine biosynthesis adenylyltransferase